MAATAHLADQYFTLESRLESFQSAQQLSKRRASNASTKGSKSLKWPHRFLAPEKLAKAGFFYHPLPANPDNVICFLCHRSLDGWEKGDDPLKEHLTHSPECGWAIVAAIENQDEQFSQEYPSSARMIDARKTTFANKWPHESKKGWKCKVKQMVDAGWKYTPTPEYDDMATCAYCNLALDGWEPSDKPLDEHFKRSPECTFFTLVGNRQQSPVTKKTKAKKDRTSKSSRLSTQSSFTIASDAASITDVAAEEGDSILTTATNATITKKMGKGKKAPTGKGRKAKARKAEPEPVEESIAPEPEDYGFEVKVDVAPKANRGRKRKTEDTSDSTNTTIEPEAPQPKRRVTRTRSSVAANDSLMDESTIVQGVAKSAKPARKGRQSTRKASTTSVAVRKEQVPNDEELDAALEADLAKQASDDEAEHARIKKSTSSSKVPKTGYEIFGTHQIEIDEAVIEAELEMMEIAESKPLPKAKGAKGRQPRKVSVKQQTAARKAAEAEAAAAAQKAATEMEDEDASQQITLELENSISMQHPSPIVQSKRPGAISQQIPENMDRVSALHVHREQVFIGNSLQINSDQDAESGNDTDASIASQSTVVRGGKTGRGSKLLRAKAGKKVMPENIVEIVHQTVVAANNVENAATFMSKAQTAPQDEDVTMGNAGLYTVAQELQPEVRLLAAIEVQTSASSETLLQVQADAAAESQGQSNGVDRIWEDREPQPKSKPLRAKHQVSVRSPTPPPKARTPSQSPQSSDAENHPPSSKPSTITKKVTTPRATTTCIPLATATPIMSPSKRNVIAGLQSSHPWFAVDLDTVFLGSPGNENSPGKRLIGDTLRQAKKGDLSSPEKKMTVEEWIQYNADIAEETLRNECERMVSTFESQGTRAMLTLEGIECTE
ncbi:hypothetical protein B0O99DRAFT_223344 [Bisporella sp. PMI_857]|nr:hypothetical protein B0O99DRAFT_223344 [Bisporella sp. PMI_857]